MRKERFPGAPSRWHEEHSNDGKNEQRHAEGRGEKPYSWLFKLPSRPGKEQDGGKEHGVGKILSGAIARFPRRGDPPRCVSPGCDRFHGAADLVEIRHKWVRVGGAILEWLLREPFFIGIFTSGGKRSA